MRAINRFKNAPSFSNPGGHGNFNQSHGSDIKQPGDKRQQPAMLSMGLVLTMAGCTTLAPREQITAVDGQTIRYNPHEGISFFDGDTVRQHVWGIPGPLPTERWPVFSKDIQDRWLLADDASLRSNVPKFFVDGPFGNIEYYRIHHATVEKRGTIVFIPGMPGISYDFHKIGANLAKSGFEIYAFSAPGLGYSTRNAENFNYTLDDYGRLIRWFLQGMDVGPCYLAAHSFAGTTATHSILRYGKEDLGVQGLIEFSPVNFATFPEIVIPTNSENLMAKPVFGELGLITLSWLPAMGPRAGYQELFRHLTPQASAFYTEEYMRHWNDGSFLLFMSPALAADTRMGVASQNEVYRSPRCYAMFQARNLFRLQDLPILFFHPTEDEFFSRDYLNKEFESLRRVSKHPATEHVELPNVGHLSFFVEPKTVATVTATITGWVDENQNR